MLAPVNPEDTAITNGYYPVIYPYSPNYYGGYSMDKKEGSTYSQQIYGNSLQNQQFSHMVPSGGGLPEGMILVEDDAPSGSIPSANQVIPRSSDLTPILHLSTEGATGSDTSDLSGFFQKKIETRKKQKELSHRKEVKKKEKDEVERIKYEQEKKILEDQAPIIPYDQIGNPDFFDQDDQNDDCQHIRILDNGFCRDCGITVSRRDHIAEGDYIVTTDQKPKMCLKFLDKLDIPECVRNKANEIYMRMKTGVHRKKRLQLLIFKCLYQAYINLKIPVDQKDLISKVGIDKNSIQAALSMYSESQTEVPTPCVKKTPNYYIKIYCPKLEISDEMIRDICSFSDSLIQRHPSIMEQSPSNMAAAIIKYYCEGHSLILDKETIITKIMITSATLDNYYRIVSSLDNG